MKITILTRNSFPLGMATTRRMLLLAKAISLGQIHSVNVLVTQVPPKHLADKELPPKGVCDGIDFEYTTKTTRRARSFFVRRLIEALGILNAILLISKRKINGEIDCIYLWETVQKITLFRFIIIIWGKLFKVPLVQELNERTWKDNSNKYAIRNSISPLFGIKGVICISNYLAEWAQKESCNKETVHVIKIPVVVDLDESYSASHISSKREYFLFSGSPVYSSSIKFILEAMRKVWERYPQTKLRITGFDLNDKRATWFQYILKNDLYLRNNVEIAGYLPRQELLENYKNAEALLIPLFDDLPSRARFPTKIGEYLASGRPIVTCGFGEVSEYLIDKKNALVSQSESIESFSEKLCYVKDHPAIVTSIGKQGKILAKEAFDYKNYSMLINNIFENVMSKKL